MDKSAVVPQDNMVINIFGILKKEEEGTIERLKQDDELWSLFYRSEYFEMIDKFINNLCIKLDDLEGDAFENGASNEEIVMRRAVARLTKVNLKSLITKIEQTGKQK